MYSCLNKMKSSNVSFDFNEEKSCCGITMFFEGEFQRTF